MTHPISLFFLAALLVNVFVWAYVYGQRNLSKVTRAYLQLTAVFIVWVGADFLMTLPFFSCSYCQKFVDILSTTAWQPIGHLTVVFALAFTGRRPNAMVFATGIGSIISILITVSTNLICAGHVDMWWGRDELYGPLLVPASVGLVLIPVSYSIYVFWSKMREPGTPPHQRQQLRLLIRGTLLTLFISVLTDVVLRSIPSLSTLLPDLGAETTMILSLHAYVAVKRHNMLAVTFDKVASRVFEKVSDGAIVIDHRGRILMANDAAKGLLGACGAGLEGQNIDSILPGCDFRKCSGCEIKLERSGETVFVWTKLSPLVSEGIELGKIVLIRDVTERRQAEGKLREQAAELAKMNEKLQREMEDKNDFLRVVSHDLGAPLRNIVGLADSIVRRHHQGLSEEVKDRLERIRRNAEAEIALIGELLELSRIRTRRGTIAEADIGELAREAIERLHSDLESKRIELRLAASWPKLVCEKARIIQVFQNLVDNAAKYMHRAEGGLIELGWREDPDRFVFWVRDNGPGVAEEEKDSLFRVFRRGRAAAELGVPGKGVGLAAVKAIVELHGGEIWVESKLGEGSTFYFSLAKSSSKSVPQSAETDPKKAEESWAAIDAAAIRARLAEEGCP